MIDDQASDPPSYFRWPTPPPPASRADIEEAGTEKPLDHKKALGELLEASETAIANMRQVMSLDVDCGIFGRLRDASDVLAARCGAIRATFGPRTHHVKADPKPFELVRAGLKPYEVRVFDRDYRVGDVLVLQEFVRERMAYTGRWIRAHVTAITRPGEYGLPDNVGVLGIEVDEVEA